MISELLCHVFIVSDTLHGRLYDDGVTIYPSVTLQWVEMHIYLFFYLLSVAAYKNINYRLCEKAKKTNRVKTVTSGQE